jgi:hydroxymethylbilane synthase
MMRERLLRLGTRRSALARAQSGLMARALERAHPGLRVELIGIDTRGDRILDQPLSQVEGKEFFTAELDRALAAGEVDCTVHSYKDLALDRPSQLQLAAVPRRENPRDIAIFAPDAAAQLARGLPLRIGTSSPRRVAFLPAFLQRALPGGNALVELVELRGNVDSRLRRLYEPRGAARQLDGIVLALAGMSRLWQDTAAGRPLLQELLSGLPRLLLPLTACPAAPAQGALAIECRSDDDATRALLAVLDDADTRAAVRAEREILAARGGGCHQRLGATQVQVPGLGTLLHVREADAAGMVTATVSWQAAPPLPTPTTVRNAWDGSNESAPAARALAAGIAAATAALAEAPATFVAHRRAWPAGATTRASVWVPGTETWYALARQGVWVTGCAEGLGFDTLGATLAEPALQLPLPAEWLVLTHAAAVDGWADAGGARVIATYEHEAAASTAASEGSPRAASHIWWHSAAQFAHWNAGGRANFAPAVHHACAFGKTAARLRAAGLVNVSVFPGVNEWRDWLKL